MNWTCMNMSWGVCMCVLANRKMQNWFMHRKVKAKGQDIHKCKCCVQRGGLTLNIHTHTHTHTPYLDPHPIWTHTLEATLMDVAYMYEWLIKPFSVCVLLCVQAWLHTFTEHWVLSVANFSHYRWNKCTIWQTLAHNLWLCKKWMLTI